VCVTIHATDSVHTIKWQVLNFEFTGARMLTALPQCPLGDQLTTGSTHNNIIEL